MKYLIIGIAQLPCILPLQGNLNSHILGISFRECLAFLSNTLNLDWTRGRRIEGQDYL